MVWRHAGDTAVIGVGMSDIHRRTTIPLGALAAQAIDRTLEDCGLTRADIDGIATYPTAPFAGATNRDGDDVIAVPSTLTPSGFPNVRWYAQAGQGLIAASVRDGVNALLAGACDFVLVWRAMYAPPGTYGLLSQPRATGDSQFTLPYGMSGPIQGHALAFRRYLEQYGGDRDSLAELAVSSRRNANLNPFAAFQDTPLSRDDYLRARMIADPLVLFDCDVPVTACAAMVLTLTERARDLVRRPVRVAAIDQQTAPTTDRIYYALADPMLTGAPMVQRMWEQSGFGPADMDAAQLYDGFSPSALYWLEASGFCQRGEALDFIRDGRIALDGEMPVNTFGGSLSQGRLHGMGHVLEAVHQLRGTAGLRQLADPQAMLVADGSPMLRGGGMVLVSDRADVAARV